MKSISQQHQLTEDALNENKPSGTEELLQQPYLITSHGSKMWQNWNEGDDVARDALCWEFSSARMVLQGKI